MRYFKILRFINFFSWKCYWLELEGVKLCQAKEYKSIFDPIQCVIVMTMDTGYEQSYSKSWAPKVCAGIFSKVYIYYPRHCPISKLCSRLLFSYIWYLFITEEGQSWGAKNSWMSYEVNSTSFSWVLLHPVHPGQYDALYKMQCNE